METTGEIKVKAKCIFLCNNKLLVADGRTLKGKGIRKIIAGNFYSFLGGSINFSETAEQGIRREIREEVGSEIEELVLVDVIENIFTYDNKQNHEIIFLFKGRFAKSDLNFKEKIRIDEEEYEFDAVWIPKEEALNGTIPLYPKFDYKKIL
jgi:8-oxo-dGTP pyrophosphatase MutT (NUDIX family)